MFPHPSIGFGMSYLSCLHLNMTSWIKVTNEKKENTILYFPEQEPGISILFNTTKPKSNGYSRLHYQNDK